MQRIVQLPESALPSPLFHVGDDARILFIKANKKEIHYERHLKPNKKTNQITTHMQSKSI